MIEKGKPKSEIDHLKDLIGQSGFPLEVEVASLVSSTIAKMKRDDVELSMGSYYLDKDENKGRELDLQVSIPIVYERIVDERVSEDIGMFLDVLVQCKRLPGNVWVFFKTPQSLDCHPQSVSVLSSLKGEPASHLYLTLLPNLHYKSVPKTTMYAEYILDENKTNKRVDNLFEGIVSLVKATNYQRESILNSFKELIETEDDASFLDYINVFYAALVFDGKIYLVERIGDCNEMDLKPVDHVCLYFDYISGACKMDLGIDIVQRGAFQRYFKSIIDDTKILGNALEGKTGQEYRQKVKTTLESYWEKKR